MNGRPIVNYEERIKYPRTYHFSFSPGLQNDDRVILNLNGFVGHEIVVTEKFDGENSTISCAYSHARSLDSPHHWTRDWVKRLQGEIGYMIPEGWRICGENMFAQHSIAYDDLESYFYGFSIWDHMNYAIDWDGTLDWFKQLGITPVRQLYRGAFDLNVIHEIADSLDTNKHEGFVVRVTDAIPYNEFDKKVAKWVRPGHVQTTEHWMHSAIKQNGLKDKS